MTERISAVAAFLTDIERLKLVPAHPDLAGRSPIPVDLDVQVPRMPSQAEFAGYFVICEALTNVVRHAGAARADVTVEVL